MTIRTPTEGERWAEAHELIRQHGEALSKVYAAECMKLAEAADWDGVGHWVDIIHRCEHLRHSSPVIPIALARAGFKPSPM